MPSFYFIITLLLRKFMEEQFIACEKALNWILPLVFCATLAIWIFIANGFDVLPIGFRLKFGKEDLHPLKMHFEMVDVDGKFLWCASLPWVHERIVAVGVFRLRVVRHAYSELFVAFVWCPSTFPLDQRLLRARNGRARTKKRWERSWAAFLSLFLYTAMTFACVPLQKSSIHKWHRDYRAPIVGIGRMRKSKICILNAGVPVWAHKFVTCPFCFKRFLVDLLWISEEFLFCESSFGTFTHLICKSLHFWVVSVLRTPTLYYLLVDWTPQWPLLISNGFGRRFDWVWGFVPFIVVSFAWNVFDAEKRKRRSETGKHWMSNWFCFCVSSLGILCVEFPFAQCGLTPKVLITTLQNCFRAIYGFRLSGRSKLTAAIIHL